MKTMPVFCLVLLILHVVFFVINECTDNNEHTATRETIWMCFFAIMSYLTSHLG